MTKEQARATVDAIAGPKEAERRRMAEARQLRVLGPRSSIDLVPESDRPAVVAAAQKHALRTWYVYAPLAIYVVWVLVSMYAIAIFGRELAHPPPGMALAAIVVMIMLRKLAVRSYIRQVTANAQSEVS